MSFEKDVILLLLFICCWYDVIFVALDAKLRIVHFKILLERERTKMSRYLKTIGLIYRISSIRRNRNRPMKFDKRTVPFEDTNWSVIETSKRNTTSNRKSSKPWVRAKAIRNSTKERLLWRRKSTSRLIEYSYQTVFRTDYMDASIIRKKYIKYVYLKHYYVEKLVKFLKPYSSIF